MWQEMQGYGVIYDVYDILVIYHNGSYGGHATYYAASTNTVTDAYLPYSSTAETRYLNAGYATIFGTGGANGYSIRLWGDSVCFYSEGAFTTAGLRTDFNYTGVSLEAGSLQGFKIPGYTNNYYVAIFFIPRIGV